jgi:hypothetical protein
MLHSKQNAQLFFSQNHPTIPESDHRLDEHYPNGMDYVRVQGRSVFRLQRPVASHTTCNVA